MATRASRIALAGSNISSTGEVDADLLDNTDSAAFLSLDGDGRLGIGTNNPTVPLHIVSSSTTMARFVGSNVGNLYITNDSDNVMTLQASTNTALSFNTSGANERMRIDASGNVGIGTTSPLSQLQVGGSTTVSADSKIILGKSTAASQTHLPVIQHSSTGGLSNDLVLAATSGDGAIRMYTGGSSASGTFGGSSNAERLRIDKDGNASFHGNHIQLPKSATNPTGTNSGQLYYDTTNNAVKFYDGTSWRLVNEIGVRVTSFDVFGDSSSVALYQLNGNGNDTGGNYNLSINGASFNTGKFGNAWNGTGTNAAYSGASGLNLSGAWSMSFWYKSSTTNQDNKRLVSLKGSNITAGWNNYNGSLGFYIGGVNLVSSATSVTRVSQIPDASVNDGSWHHLAFSVTNGGSWVIYLDGTSYSGAVSGEGRSFNSNNYLAITNYDTGNGYNTTGLVDQLRIFNRVITAGEVAQLYNTSG